MLVLRLLIYALNCQNAIYSLYKRKRENEPAFCGSGRAAYSRVITSGGKCFFRCQTKTTILSASVSSRVCNGVHLLHILLRDSLQLLHFIYHTTKEDQSQIFYTPLTVKLMSEVTADSL